MKIGAIVIMTFDDRGLARIVDEEDGRYEIEYLPDTDRRSEHVRTGDREWASPADLDDFDSFKRSPVGQQIAAEAAR